MKNLNNLDKLFSQFEMQERYAQMMDKINNPLGFLDAAMKKFEAAGHVNMPHSAMNYVMQPSVSISRLLKQMDNAAIHQNTMQSELFGSAASDLWFKNSNKFTEKAMGSISLIQGLNTAIKNHLELFERQQSISASLSNSFAERFSFEEIAREKFEINYAEKAMRISSLLSGTTFYNTVKIIENDEAKINKAYDEVEFELEQNPEFKNEVVNFQAGLLRLKKQKKKQKKSKKKIRKNEKWYSLPEIKTYVEIFLNKVLIQRFGMNPTTAIIFLLMVLLAFGFIKECYFEAKGADYYNAFVGENTKESVEKLDVDFTVDDSPIFIQHSLKAKKIGCFAINSEIKILKIVNGWCLVEGVGIVTKKNTRANRKKYKHDAPPIKISKSIRGWVQKVHLDMFQL